MCDSCIIFIGFKLIPEKRVEQEIDFYISVRRFGFIYKDDSPRLNIKYIA